MDDPGGSPLAGAGGGVLIGALLAVGIGSLRFPGSGGGVLGPYVGAGEGTVGPALAVITAVIGILRTFSGPQGTLNTPATVASGLNISVTVDGSLELNLSGG